MTTQRSTLSGFSVRALLIAVAIGMVACATPAGAGRQVVAQPAPVPHSPPPAVPPTVPRAAASLQVLGQHFLEAESALQSGEFSHAEAVFRRILAELDSAWPGSLPVATQARERLGMLLHWRGRYAESDQMMRAAYDGFIAAGGPLNPRAARTTAIWAGMLRERFEFETEQQMLRAGLAQWEQAFGPDHPQVAWFRSELAVSHIARGDLDSAQALLERAESSLERALGSSSGSRRSQIQGALGGVLRNLAAVLDWQGKPARAIELYRRSLPLTREAFGNHHPTTGLATSLFGIFLAKHRQFQEADELLREARAIYRGSLPPNHIAFINLALKQGVLALDSGDAAAAVEHFRNAVALAEQNSSSQQSLALTKLAEAHEAAGDLREALLAEQQALAIAQKRSGRMHPATLLAWKGLARIALHSGDTELALKAYREAAETSEEALTRTLLLGSERQRRSYVARRGLRKETDTIIDFHLQHAANAPEALDLAFTTLLRRKGRALEASTDAMLSVRRQLKPEAVPLFEDFQRQRGAAAALALRGPMGRQTQEDFERSLAILHEKSDELERQLGLSTRLTAPAPMTLALAQAALPTDGVLLEFVKYQPSPPSAAKGAAQSTQANYALYVLPARGVPTAYDLGPAKATDALVASLRVRLARQRREWQQPARALYERLIRPAIAQLAANTRLFIAPDSALNLVPFAVLLDEHAEPLLSAHALSYVSSGRDRARPRAKPNAREPALVMAAPNYDAFAAAPPTPNGLLHQVRFPPLPGTLDEAQGIASVFGSAIVRTGDDASEAALHAVHSPAFLHIATHAFFLDGAGEAESDATRGIFLSPSSDSTPDSSTNEADSPLPVEPLLRSGLALAGANHGGPTASDDGLMTALELTALELEGTQLVTLSACDTGLGQVRDAEGVFGLRRALVLAGSHSQLLSLWRVADRPTQALMTSFYQRLARGEAPSAALREVQLDGWRQAAHPYFWAPFVLSGEDEPLTR